MRLSLLAIPAFLFINTWAHSQTVYTIGSGGNFATLTAAEATVTPSAGDSVSFVANTTGEAVIVDGIFPATIFGNNYSMTGTAGPVLQFNVTRTTDVWIDKLRVIHTTGDAAAVSIVKANTDGGKYTFVDCNISNSVAGRSSIHCNPMTLTVSNQFNVLRCKISCGSTNANMAALDLGTDSHGVQDAINIRESIFTAPSAQALRNHSDGATTILNVLYCDMVNSATGIFSQSRMNVKNCLFMGNTADTSLAGSGTGADFYNCGFGQLGSLASSTNCLFSLTSARTFCDPVNFYLSPASLTLNAGVSIDLVTGVDIGLNGVRQGSNNILGMGANPYSPALCPGYGAGK